MSRHSIVFTSPASDSPPSYSMEIAHIRNSEVVMTSSTVTTVFGVVSTVIPLLVFGWLMNGANMKGLNVPASVLFCTISVFAVLLCSFFAGLNLVKTVAAVVSLMIPLTVIGNSVMRRVRRSGVLIF